MLLFLSVNEEDTAISENVVKIFIQLVLREHGRIVVKTFCKEELFVMLS